MAEVTIGKIKDEMISVEIVKVDLDSILINEVGEFGRYQMRMLALGAIIALFCATNTEYVFSTARIRTRCLVPQCENASNTEFSLPWLANALPSSGGSLNSCTRFADNITQNDSYYNDFCPAELFDSHVVLPCEEHVYENTETVVYSFALGCDEWRRSLIGFTRTVGSFFTHPITGFVSDRWGRSIALALSAFNSAWIGLARYCYSTFVALQFFEAMLSAGTFASLFILVQETLGPKYRVIAGGFLYSFFSVGNCCMALAAWNFPAWKSFTLAIYIPKLITISYFWVMPESVRWYLSKGRYEESETLLKKIARTNGKELTEKSLLLLRASIQEKEKKKTIKAAKKKQEPWLPVLVFRHKQILIRCMILPICWITNTLVYYGLSINSLNISGNKYINFMVVSAGEIPGFWLSVLLLNKIGRKPVLTGAFWICAACQAAYVFMPGGNYGLSLAVYLVGKSSIATTMTAINVYTSEVFPTQYRHRLFAFSTMTGRLGSIVAPLTPAMAASTFDEMPFILFGSFALLSGTLIFFMPETLGTKLPDTMEEADNLQHKRVAT